MTKKLYTDVNESKFQSHSAEAETWHEDVINEVNLASEFLW